MKKHITVKSINEADAEDRDALKAAGITGAKTVVVIREDNDDDDGWKLPKPMRQFAKGCRSFFQAFE